MNALTLGTGFPWTLLGILGAEPGNIHASLVIWETIR